MPQAIHIESLAVLSDKPLWQRAQAWLYSYKHTLHSATNQFLEMAVTVAVQRRSQQVAPTPLRYSRLNRHTWRRYSALIVARDELVVEESKTPILNPEPVEISEVVKPIVKQVFSVNVNRVAVQPIWATANHDWESFEAIDD